MVKYSFVHRQFGQCAKPPMLSDSWSHWQSSDFLHHMNKNVALTTSAYNIISVSISFLSGGGGRKSCSPWQMSAAMSQTKNHAFA